MLPAIDAETRSVWAIIETSKGQPNKLKFDETHGLFRLSKVLPAGSVFPFDFGFIPSTLGGDGDPLDVLVLLDAPTPTGCAVTVRLIGVLHAEQTENGRRVENDRLIAVATHSRTHERITALTQLAKPLRADIEHFFIAYNAAEGRRFVIRGRGGPAAAARELRKGMTQFSDKAARRPS